MLILKDNASFHTNVERAFNDIDGNYKSYRGVVVVGTHNPRELDDKLEKIREAREKGIPFLGICFGMQLALIEYARTVLGIKDATSEEISKGAYIIKKLPDLRVGIFKVEGEMESHWHHFAFNEKYKQDFERDWSLSFTDGVLEIAMYRKHPFFILTQFHVEYKHKHKLIVDFLKVCKNLTPKNAKGI